WIGTRRIHFQPSEIAKFCLIIYVAKLLSLPQAKSPRKRSISPVLWIGPPLAIATIYILLIEREPDMGTAVILFIAILAQLFLAGMRKRHIVMLLGATAVLGMMMVNVFSHRTDRIGTFFH